MEIIGVSGKESRIVKIVTTEEGVETTNYYLITDYGTVNELEQQYYHANGLVYHNHSWWQPQMNEHYIIDRLTDEVFSDPRYEEETPEPEEIEE